jgi:hypothetical protein
MNAGRTVALIGASLLFVELVAGDATAQGGAKVDKKQLIGEWELVAADNVRTDGSKIHEFGPNPKGIAIFEPDGVFSAQFVNPDRPNFANNNRLQGTPDENKSAAQGSLAYFGTYSVNETQGTLVFHIRGSSFPNFTGKDLQRTITSLTPDELVWKVVGASVGGTPEVVWKREK